MQDLKHTRRKPILKSVIVVFQKMITYEKMRNIIR